jgi:DNA-binding NtrC family response regulator
MNTTEAPPKRQRRPAPRRRISEYQDALDSLIARLADRAIDGRPLVEVECTLTLRAVRDADCNCSVAATRLGISPASVYRRVRRYLDIDAGERRGAAKAEQGEGCWLSTRSPRVQQPAAGK